MSNPIVFSIGAGTAGPVEINAGMLNRHGLVSGATGTGKTVTLQVLAEALSAIGVPVFTADVKGDLTGLSERGQASAAYRRTHSENRHHGFSLR